MKFRQIAAASVVALVLGAGPALAAGFLTNGLPVAGGSQFPTTLPLTGQEAFPADTNLPSGQNPASEAITIQQLRTFIAGYGVAKNLGNVTTASSTFIDPSVATFFTIGLGTTSSFDNPATTNIVEGYTFEVQVNQISGTAVTLVWGDSGTSKFKFPATSYATGAAGTTVAAVPNCSAIAGFAPAAGRCPAPGVAGSFDLFQFVYDGTNFLGVQLVKSGA